MADMLKRKWILIGVLGLISLSSCGIFHKGCGCPHFGRVDVRMRNDVQMCGSANVLG
jgi:hypothetical protein